MRTEFLTHWAYWPPIFSTGMPLLNILFATIILRLFVFRWSTLLTWNEILCWAPELSISMMHLKTRATISKKFNDGFHWRMALGLERFLSQCATSLLSWHFPDKWLGRQLVHLLSTKLNLVAFHLHSPIQSSHLKLPLPSTLNLACPRDSRLEIPSNNLKTFLVAMKSHGQENVFTSPSRCVIALPSMFIWLQVV